MKSKELGEAGRYPFWYFSSSSSVRPESNDASLPIISSFDDSILLICLYAKLINA